ncbi:16S rRNA (cytidine(1402)-2'-O)-methyltransferase [Petrachloros mirabilis]
MARQRSQPKYRNQQDFATPRDSTGTLFIVGTPIGSPDDLTIRALTILKRVKIIAAETPAATQALLAHHGVYATLTSYGPVNRDEKIAVLLHHLRQGHDIALVSDSGMPIVYDPGRMLIAAAQQSGYPVTVIPGPSALTAAVALSGYSGDRIAFSGQLPGTSRLLNEFLKPFRRKHETLVMFASSGSCPRLLHSLLRILPSRQVTLAIDMTKTSERLYRGTPASLLKQIRSLPKSSEVTVVVEGKTRNEVGGQKKRTATAYSSARRRIITR